VNWRFELTPELVPRHRQQLVWALQRQDERFQSYFRVSTKRRPPWTFVVLGVIGFTTLGLLVRADRKMLDHWIWLSLGALVFAGALVRGIRLSVRGTNRPGLVWRVTNRTIANIADRTFRKVNATLLIEYELTGTQLRSRVASASIDHAVDLAKIKIAIATPNSVVLFRRRFYQVPKRIIYVDGAERDAVLAVLSRATVERVDGPVEGYAADSEIPRAIVR